MRKFSRILLCLGCATLSQSVIADSYSSEQEPTKPVAYHHTQRGDWFTRLRALYILPNDSSGSVSSIPHSGVSVHPSWTGEFDFGYMFTKNLGCELILATSKHTLMGKSLCREQRLQRLGCCLLRLRCSGVLSQSTLFSLMWGAGVNYTLFYSEHCALAGTHIDLEHSWGPVVQAGMDMFFYKDWFFNVDVKYIWMTTEAHLTGAVKGRVHVDIDPWVIGFGVGRKW